MKIYVVLPIFNEEKALTKLVHDIIFFCNAIPATCLIIAVDDCSSDSSPKILRTLSKTHPIHILSHTFNRGLGETIRDGFECAANMAAAGDIILRLDADASHEPRYIPKLVAAITKAERGEVVDMAIASRFATQDASASKERGLSVGRALISRLANVYFRLCFPLGNVKEYTCGYRAYRAEIVQKALAFYGNELIQLRGLGFCCTVEKLLKLHLMGAKIVEVPFELRYDLKESESKMSFNVTTFGYFVMFVLYHWPFGGWRPTARNAAK